MHSYVMKGQALLPDTSRHYNNKSYNKEMKEWRVGVGDYGFNVWKTARVL